jgi:uncharacterized protein (DUF885 family)
MREQQGDDPITTARFRDVATRVLDALLEASPEQATILGEHRFDDQLTDYSAPASAARATMLTEALAALDDVDDTGLLPDDRVDLEILRTRVTGDLWELTELRPHERDPLLHLPGDGLYPLIARDTLPAAERLRALTARLVQVPERLATAREVLRDVPRVHVETAIDQVRGIRSLLTDEFESLLQQEAGSAGRAAAARDDALEALAGHARWLEAQLPVADGDPRLGEQAYAARLWYTLDTETGPDALLTRAESDLQAIEEELSELASKLAGAPPSEGQVRQMLDRSAALAPVDDRSILTFCRAALADLTARVTELDLVTVPPAPVQIVVMPPARRGLAVAYCDGPGPLEPTALDGTGPAAPWFFAVSPTPEGWDADRVASFYREYNGHMLRNVTVHEAMPGHVLQMAHAARYRGATQVRSAAWSGPFVEGWAVYAEELMARSGLGGSAEDDANLRLQQLKMQLRTTINAILDVRVHSRGMTEDEAMLLMTRRGHQEEGEAAGKWRRALLTSTQLSTYYVGYREIADIARQLRATFPQWSSRQLHDAVLAHGAPPPRHLRALLDLPHL